MSSIRTTAAAAMLGVSPNTLRSWERRYGFPAPRRSAGGHRHFDLVEVEALRSALEQTRDIASAVVVARERGAGPASGARLRAALTRFDETAADRVAEESLGVRSVERTVDEVILPAVESLRGPRGEDADGPEFGVAWRWASGWLAAQRRVAPPASRDEAVVLLDASAPGDLDALHVQALELLLRRGGLRALTLGVAGDVARLTGALHAVAPSILVVAGCRMDLESLGRVVHIARRVTGPGLVVLDFRRAVPDTGASTMDRLGDRPLAARDLVLAHLDPTPRRLRAVG